MGSERPAARRRYGAGVKVQAMAAYDEHGASVAKIAMAHGIDANVVHRWRKLARKSANATPTRTTEFVPVTLAVKPVRSEAGDIQIQQRLGSTATTITWPVSAAADFKARYLSGVPPALR